jgi:hypothetical protein
MVMGGLATILRFEPLGHEVMKPAARVNTFLTPRGVSKADGTAEILDAVRIKV